MVFLVLTSSNLTELMDFYDCPALINTLVFTFMPIGFPAEVITVRFESLLATAYNRNYVYPVTLFENMIEIADSFTVLQDANKRID